MHRINGIEKRGCPFNSVAKKMLLEANHKNSRDYDTYRAVFEEIENINFSPKKEIDSDNSEIGGPALGTSPN